MNQMIYVRPAGINSILFTYMRSPVTPYWDYDISASSGLPVYLPPGSMHDGTNPLTPSGPSLSTTFEYANSAVDAVIQKLVEYISLSTRNQFGAETVKINKP